jgi:transcription antitermination factor NusG
MDEWVTLQLSEKGEMVLEDNPSLIEGTLKKIFKSEIFFPVYFNKVNSYDNRIYLFKGYVFIKYDKKEDKLYNKITNTQYFLGPLRSDKNLFLTSGNEIKKLKKQLEKLIMPNVKNGDRVRVIDGKYKNLTAVITEYHDDTKEADLTVKLKCLSILVPKVPVACLIRDDESKEEEDISKKSLQKRILDLLGNHPKGLTRKEIISKIDLTEDEKKRVSTSLSRAVKRKLIDSNLVNGR